MVSDGDKNKDLQHSDKSNLSITEWMKRDWDKRAETDAKYYIRTTDRQTEEEFWDSGKPIRDNLILGLGTPRYDLIFKNKNPKEMKVLEIGCGIGRILNFMADIFGQAYGVDVSGKMIKSAKKKVKKTNCKFFENNGIDLSIFSNDYFDFCFSLSVFQHIPEKEVILNYFNEVSRVLKTGCLFRFQIHGDTKWNPDEFNPWYGVHFTSKEILDTAKKNNFKILEEDSTDGQYYWYTFQSIK